MHHYPKFIYKSSDGHPDYPAKVGDNLAIALGGKMSLTARGRNGPAACRLRC